MNYKKLTRHDENIFNYPVALSYSKKVFFCDYESTGWSGNFII